MAQIEKIIAEIERLKEEFVPTVNFEYQDFAKYLLDEVIDSINSLSAVQQQSENLEKEIKLYQLRNPVINHNERSLNELIKRVATYFANWQKEQMIKKLKEWVSENAYLYTDTENDEEGYRTTVFLEDSFVNDLVKTMEDEQ